MIKRDPIYYTFYTINLSPVFPQKNLRTTSLLFISLKIQKTASLITINNIY